MAPAPKGPRSEIWELLARALSMDAEERRRAGIGIPLHGTPAVKQVRPPAAIHR